MPLCPNLARKKTVASVLTNQHCLSLSERMKISLLCCVETKVFEGMWSVFAAITGSLLTAFITIVWSRIYDSHKAKQSKHEEYLAWLRGLKIECKHVVSCIDEVKDGEAGFVSIKEGKFFGCITKRLNEDLFQRARIEVIRHPRSCVLQEPLTTAYRDIVHTNGMMDRYEQKYHCLVEKVTLAKPGDELPDTRNEILGILDPTIAALNGVRGSVENLRKIVEEQDKLELQNPPKIEFFAVLRGEA